MTAIDRSPPWGDAGAAAVLNFNHLYYFHVTASEGSIARAAAKLGVGVPTISEQIRMLERDLGTPLFERIGGRLRLTADGRHAFDHTSVMFRAGERLVQSLIGDRAHPPLHLRVGVSAGVSRTVATEFLMPLLALDDVVPTISVGEAADLLRDLRAHALDLLLTEADPGESARTGLELVRIHQPRVVAITARDVTLPDRWEGAALVHYRPGSILRLPIDEYLEAADLRPRIAAETDDALVMLAAVRQGGFTAFVPWSVARERVTSGELVVVAELGPHDAGVHALFHDSETATVARRAVDLLVQFSRDFEPA